MQASAPLLRRIRARALDYSSVFAVMSAIRLNRECAAHRRRISQTHIGDADDIDNAPQGGEKRR